jgi:hypothetical protein
LFGDIGLNDGSVSLSLRGVGLSRGSVGDLSSFSETSFHGVGLLLHGIELPLHSVHLSGGGVSQSLGSGNQLVRLDARLFRVPFEHMGLIDRRARIDKRTDSHENARDNQRLITEGVLSPPFKKTSFATHIAVAVLALIGAFICTFYLYLVLLFSDAPPHRFALQAAACLVGAGASIALFIWTVV